MQPYMNDAPVVEVQQDQHLDQSLTQLHQDLQQELQQQISDHQQRAAAAETSSTPADDTIDDDIIPAQCESPAAPAAATPDSPELAAAAATEEADTAAVQPSSSAEADAEATEAASPVRAASVTSERSGCEDEWQLVSPHGSVRLPSSSGRYSFDCAGTASPTLEVASASSACSECSASDTTTTPKDELAESILGHSVLMAGGPAAAASALQQSGCYSEHAHSDDCMEAVRGASLVSSEGGLDGLDTALPADPTAACAADVDVAAQPPAAAAAAPAGADNELAGNTGSEHEHAVVLSGDAAEVLTGLGLLSGEVAQLMGAAQSRATVSLEGLREWLIESLAALVQTGRTSHAACLSTAQSIQRSLYLAAKEGGLAAAAVNAATDWRLVLSSAACVVCLAMWIKTRNEAATLRSMLRRRDHELSKLVMRVVSLQELLNQGTALPITRYMRYEGAAAGAAAASYM